MLKSSKNIETNVYALEIEVSGEVFTKALDQAFNKQKGKIQLPGFRKGRATRKMVENFYGKGYFYEDAIDLCFSDAVTEACKEAGLDAVGTKKADIEEISDNGFSMTVEVYVKPEVEVTAYKELKATKKKVDVTDEEVEARIQELVERNARMVTVEDRAVQDGDIAVIDFEGFLDGVAFDGGKGENYELTIGSGSFVPGFEEQIIGHNTNDEFDIDITFPEDYHEGLAGKAVVFKIKLHEIKVKELPEVDDEFAQDAADYDTVDAMKKGLAAEIKARKEEENAREIEAQLLDKLSENVKGEIPEIMYENEIDAQIRDLDYRFSMQGMSFATYLQYTGMTMETYREQMKESAMKNVKIRLALEKIAAVEALDATEEEIEAEYAKFAAQYHMEVEKIKEVVPVDGLKADMLKEKAIKFVIDNAKVTTQRKPRAKKEEAPQDAE